MSGMPDSLPYWIVGALALFWFVGAYNRLVRLRSAALQAYAALDAALVRQLDFVQARAGRRHGTPAAPQAAVGRLAAGAPPASWRPCWPRPACGRSTRPALPRSARRMHVLLGAWQRLHPDAVVSFEADGTLSRPAPLDGQDEPMRSGGAAPIAWPEPSAAAEIARSQFNLAVAQYNAAIAQFPALLVAWIMQLRSGGARCADRARARPSRPPLPSTQVARSFRSLPARRPFAAAVAPVAAHRCGAGLDSQRRVGLRRLRGRRAGAAARRAGARLPGAALARPRRGAAPPTGQAHAAARGRRAALHRARAGLGRRALALRAVHAGRPGRRGRQAQSGHACAGQLHQRLPAPLPARARRAGRGHRARARSRNGTTRAGGSSGSSATIRATGSACWRPTTRRRR